MRNPRNREPQSVLIKRLTEYYQGEGKIRPGTFDLRWAVLRCCFRHGLTNAQTAEILGVDEETIRFEADIAIQDAQ